MKKIIATLLALSMLVLCVPTVFAAGEYVKREYGYHKVPILSLGAFEESHKGYVSTAETFDDKLVRSIKRDGSDDTATDFNLYHWSTPLADENGEYIPLSTTNYIVVEYYYHSPDAEPALIGNKMRWVQGRVAPEKNVADVTNFSWSQFESVNGMVANKWDTIVFAFDKQHNSLKNTMTKHGDYFLHQLKFFPLRGDMGKNDVLYLGDVIFQSWDPAGEANIAERTLSFYNDTNAFENAKAPVSTIKAKDLEKIVFPEYAGTAPENRKFYSWESTLSGNTFFPGDEYVIVYGKDESFVPVFNLEFDFTALETSYINGYEDGTFKPQDNITRAEACKIFASLVNPEGKQLGTTSYEDVKESDWFYNAVTTLEAYDAIQDIWGGKFLPSEKITRAELVRIVYAISDTDVKNLKLTYLSDIKEKENYFEAVMFAVSKGIVTGYEDGTFKPKANITRAEAVTVINRMIGRSWNGEGTSKFSDIEGHWAKGQIIASSSTKADGVWSVNNTEKEYVIEGTSAKDYIIALHTQSKDLSGDAIRRGIDVISEQIKKDILSTPNTAELYPDRIGKNTYYVSEKNGNDDNDGKSPETAVKTITGLFKKLRFPGKGTAILFERGGTYRGQVAVSAGLTYGSYGEGDKPVISGSKKNYADPSLWVETDIPNVYSLAEKITNVGVITFDHADDAHGNYDDLYGKNRIFEKNIVSYIELSEDLEFFSCADTLYLCSLSGNPGERFKDIEIGTRVDIFDGAASDMVFDNLHVKHTGSHGIGLGSGNNVVVTNCEFSWLGGSLLGDYGKTTTQYGNAVELYGNCDGFYVRNNWMWQIYDTAITHQGKNLKMKNIEYSGNLMEYCHWGIECWMTQPDSKGSLHNYLAQYNVMRDGGYGWGTIVTKRPLNSMLYCLYNFDVANDNLRNEYNIIDRCSGYLIYKDPDVTEVYSNDIYVQYEGNQLGGLKGTMAFAGLNAPILINKYMGDENPVFVLVSETE